MPLSSVADLVDVLRQYRLLEPAHLDELPGLQAALADPAALVRELVKRGWLTPYQVNALFQGQGPGLLLGSYVLLDKLGEGGMGAVYRARNWKLGRTVALKLIRKEWLGNEDAVRRFQREIRAASQLDHPNIVRAYDADEVGGRHLFAMEYVGGQDLAQLSKRHGPLPVAQACDWVRQAAVGLQHAFERGLVHRDIKPHNLLLTRDGVIKVLDLGLARVSHAAEEGETSSTMTQEGAVMGTPDYIAPEQALESHAVDIRADVYALGCTLYHLLTGRPPFPGGTLLQKLRRHEREEPTPIAALRPEVPARLAAVVRKMMAKRPEDRYQTPADAAGALAGEGEAAGSGTVIAIPAHPAAPAAAADTAPGWSELVTPATGSDVSSQLVQRRAAERRRWLLFNLAGGGVLLGLLGLLLTLMWLFGSLARRPGPAVAARDPRTLAPAGSAKVQPASPPPGAGVADPPGGKTLPPPPGEPTRPPADDAHNQRGGTAPAPAGKDRGALAPGQVRRFLPELRPRSVLTGHTGPVSTVAFDPRRSRLASGSLDRTVKVWDTQTGEALLNLTGHTREVWGVAFSPDGERLVSACGDHVRRDLPGEVILWEAATGKKLLTLASPAGGIHGVTFRPDGRRLASAGYDRTVRIWDASSGKECRALSGHTAELWGVAYSPDGKLLASAGFDKAVRLWDADSGAAVRTLEGHTDVVWGVAFSPDGQRLASTSDDLTVRVWDVASGQEVHVLRGHTVSPYGAAFSPDGRRLASASGHRWQPRHWGEVIVWDAETGKRLTAVPSPTSGFFGVAFSPDGKHLASAGMDTNVKVWDTALAGRGPEVLEKQP
jgi:WD40 repeat protein/tRNA A-37 threonylcarbamoyl transferase component Bud32